MPTKQPSISFQQIRQLTEQWQWRDGRSGAMTRGFNPPAGSADCRQVPYFVRYVTGKGYLEQGEVITLKVDLSRHQRKVKFTGSNQVRIIRDYLIIEIDGIRVITH